MVVVEKCVYFSPHSDLSRSFKDLYSWASDFAIGAVLSQFTIPHQLLHPCIPLFHPCIFFSQKLTPTERNYDVWARNSWPSELPLRNGSISSKDLMLLSKSELESGASIANTMAQPASDSLGLFLSWFGFMVTYHLSTKNGEVDALCPKDEWSRAGTSHHRH